MNILKYTERGDGGIPIKRFRYCPSPTGLKFVEVANARPFLKGPIYLDWLSLVAHLPGKALNVALAVRWLVDMNGGKPVKVTAKALALFNVSEDACSDGLKRLESAELITVKRKPGQRPIVGIQEPVPHK